MDFHLLKLREVQRRIPRSRSSLYQAISVGHFPGPIKLGRSSYWRSDEIDRLICAYSAGASDAELRSICADIQKRRWTR